MDGRDGCGAANTSVHAGSRLFARTRVRIAAWTNVHPPAPACAARLGLGIGNPVGDDQMRMNGHRARRSTGLWLVALIAASCATPEATPPSSPAAPGPVTSPSASTTPSAVASPTEASSTAPSSAAATTLAIKWNAEDLTGIGKVEAILGVMRVDDGYVLLASLPYVEEGSPNSAVWWSNDGTSWTLAKEFPVDGPHPHAHRGRPRVRRRRLQRRRRRRRGLDVDRWARLAAGE